MVIIHCLWIGALVGLVASRAIRAGVGSAPLVSTMAVGVFGALLGSLAQSWEAIRTASLPFATLVVPALGAALALAAWALAHRTVLAPRTTSQAKDRS
jgi:uncharacterized membrane protein YeaQ/YmgE (transglycosylase-associated protein family)